jgi:F0F1-type ATP synthase delta subunit
MHYSPRQYAAALNEAVLFDNNQQRAEVSDGMRRIDQLLKNAPIRSALTTPHLTPGEQKIVAYEIVTHAYKGAHELVAVLTGMLVILTQHHALGTLRAVAGLIDVTDRPELTLADHRLEQRMTLLEKRFTAPESEMTVNEKPDIIGGFVLKKGDDVLDVSIATQLQTLKLQLINS